MASIEARRLIVSSFELWFDLGVSSPVEDETGFQFLVDSGKASVRQIRALS